MRESAKGALWRVVGILAFTAILAAGVSCQYHINRERVPNAESWTWWFR